MNALPLRVLLVDDDDEDRQLIRSVLLEAIKNIVIEEMKSGQDLINWLDHQRSLESTKNVDGPSVTVILLDMHMPRMSGLETLQAMGDMRGLPYMPVVMISSSVSEPIKQRAYEKGIHLYMVKPTGHRGFYRVVEAVKNCYRDVQRMRD